MASNDHAVLDLGDEDLQFTENNYNKSSKDTSSGFTSFPESGTEGNLGGDNIGNEGLPGGESGGGGASNFWSMSFYQRFFDVDDKEIMRRLFYSMVPIPGKSFLQHHIRPKADLYGPFWSCVTLIFSIAISGNLADYFSSSILGQTKWHYDFHKVTLASTAVFSYAGLIPACLYGYLWWVGQGGGAMTVTFIELLCLYGYSVTIYIPISLLWLICVKVGWLQWLLVLVGASLSGFVLFTTVWPMVREAASKSAAIIMLVVLGLHFLLAAGFMLYFFHAPSALTGIDNVVVPTEGGQKAETNNASIPQPAALLQDKTAVTNIINTLDPGEDTKRAAEGFTSDVTASMVDSEVVAGGNEDERDGASGDVSKAGEDNSKVATSSASKDLVGKTEDVTAAKDIAKESAEGKGVEDNDASDNKDGAGGAKVATAGKDAVAKESTEANDEKATDATADNDAVAKESTEAKDKEATDASNINNAAKESTAAKDVKDSTAVKDVEVKDATIKKDAVSKVGVASDQSDVDDSSDENNVKVAGQNIASSKPSS